jgi:hypothetical protein
MRPAMGRSGGLGKDGRGMLPAGRGPHHNRMPGTPKASRATREEAEEVDSPASMTEETMTALLEEGAVAAAKAAATSWSELSQLGEDIAKRQRVAEKVQNVIMGTVDVEPEVPSFTQNATATSAATAEDNVDPIAQVPEVARTTTAGEGFTEEIQPPPIPARLQCQPSMMMVECTHYTYFDLKVPVDNSGRMEPIYVALGEFIQKVQELDETACLFPYREKDRKDAHVVIRNTPDWQQAMGRRRVTILRKYFQSVGAYGRDGFRTMQILIGSAVTAEELIEDLHEFLHPPGERYWALYKQKVQAERTKVIGWLYMSTQNINKETLREAIQKVVGFQVGLLWRVITPVQTEENRGQQDNEEVRAIHVVVDEIHTAGDTEVLSAMYAPGRTEGWPMGIRMRFVQDAENALGLEDPANLEVMRGRQAYHIARTVTTTTHDFSNIDRKSSVLNHHTLRQVLMGFSSSNPDTPLLLNIEADMQHGGHKYQVLPQYQTEAQMMINSLLPYLKHKVGQERAHRVEVLFNPHVVRRCRELVWDEKLGCVQSKMSVSLKQLVANPKDADYISGMEVVRENERRRAAERDAMFATQLRTNVDEGSLGSGTTRTLGSQDRRQGTPWNQTDISVGTGVTMNTAGTNGNQPMNTDSNQTTAQAVGMWPAINRNSGSHSLRASETPGVTTGGRDNESEHEWGDWCGEKEEGILRIGSINIGTFPSNKAHKKLHLLQEFIKRHDIDIMGLQEINTHWKKKVMTEQISELTQGWFSNSRLNVAYYKDYNIEDANQPGGVAQWALGYIADRASQRGEDETGLGRWTWQRIQGKQNRGFRVVTAYMPVINKSGPRSVWNQQKTYWVAKGVDECPRQRFQDDLLAAIEGWLENGDQLLLLMDANSDVRQSEWTELLASRGLVDLITARHGSEGPATFQLGSSPIDGIFGTPGLVGSKGGYLKSMSDHLALWIDIPAVKIFGEGWKPSTSAGGRRLKSQDPRTVERYKEALKPMFDNQRILERSERLYNERTRMPVEEVEAEWNKIDMERVKAMLAAEKKCRRFRKGKIQWTPEYAILTATLKAWSLIAARRRGKRVNTRFFARMLKRAKLLQQAGACLEIAEKAIRETRRELRVYAKLSTEKRLAWLEGLAEALALEQLQDEDLETARGERKLQQGKAKFVKMLMTREEQRRSARTIKRAWQAQNERQGLTMVIGPGPNGERVEFTEKEHIEGSLLQETKGRFNQSRDTAFMIPPLSNVVDPMGMNEFSNEILAGTATVPEEADIFARKLIEQLKRPDGVTQMDIGLHVEEYRDGWRKVRENTASGMSGIHFGHFKTHEKDLLLATLDAVLAQIPFELGFSPKRWRQGVEVMLLKLSGNFNVEKMRAILLFEADFNFNNKRWGRILMWYAEAQKLLAEEQFGSRKKLAAIDHCINKRITFDILRQNKQPGVLCSNDAKGCYDRIVHSVASICLQRLGMPTGPLRSMFTTLQNMDHFVRSSFGISEQSFNAKDVNEVAIQGIGQGNGAGPQIWAAVSTVLLNVLRAEELGSVFSTPISRSTFQFAGYAFVDDTDLVTTGGTMTDINKAIQQMQAALTTWEGCLRASGGAIEPAKTFWYSIDFEWQKGNWQYAEPTDQDLRVRGPSGELQTLEVVPVDEARRTLGVRLAPDGNDREQGKFMLEVTKKWADGIRINSLPRAYAWQSYSTTLWPKLRYGLPATNLSAKESEKVDVEIRKTLLPAIGVNRNFPRALTHGAISRGGLGIPRIYEAQGIEGIVTLVRYAHNKETMTGRLLLTSLEALQIEVGTRSPVLQTDFKTFGELATDCKVKEIWRFACASSIKVNMNYECPKPLRTNDKWLMETFAEKFPTKVLKRLNKCRIVVKAVTWSDVVTIDGKRISGRAWKGLPAATRSQWGWPRQGEPTKQDWKLWRKALMATVAQIEDEARIKQGVKNDIVPQLYIPLREWNHDFSTGWELHWATGRLYETGSKTVRLIRPGRNTRSGPSFFDFPQSYNQLPIGTAPARVKQIDDSTCQVLGWGSRIHSESTTSEVSNCSYMANAKSGFQWLWQSMEWQDDGEIVIDAIKARRAIAVSDGTLKEGKGAAAAVIEGRNKEGRLKLCALTSGESNQQSSFRSELTGILMIVSAITELCSRSNVSGGKITVGCDGLAAVQAAARYKEPIDPNGKQTDLISAIRNLVRKSPIDWRFKHVKGHTSVRPFTRHTDLNEEMDETCKAFLNDRDPIAHKEAEIPDEPASVWAGDRKIVSNMAMELTHYLQERRAEEYWGSKSRVTTAPIDWGSFAKAIKTMSRSKRIWLIKQSSSFCGVGKMMVRMGKTEDDSCPRCKAPEDANHIWTCREPMVDSLWRTWEQEIQSIAAKMEAPSEITEAMTTAAQEWRRGDEDLILGANDQMRALLTAQGDIGWQGFMEGRWTPEWRRAYADLGGKKNPNVWAARTMAANWNLGWKLWEQRNELAHKKENTTAWELLDKEIKELKECNLTRMDDLTKEWYDTNLETILAWEPNVKRDWVNRIQAVVRSNARQARATPMDRMRRNMAAFLNRQPRSTS